MNENENTTNSSAHELVELTKCIMDYYLFVSNMSFDDELDAHLERAMGMTDFTGDADTTSEKSPKIPEAISKAIETAFLNQLKKYS